MFLSSPIDACTAVDQLPNNERANLFHSLTDNLVKDMRLSVLLVQDENCDIKYKLENVQKAGYSGVIIMYSSDKNFVNIVSNTVHNNFNIFVALISISEEGQLLRNFAKNS